VARNAGQAGVAVISIDDLHAGEVDATRFSDRLDPLARADKDGVISPSSLQ